MDAHDEEAALEVVAGLLVDTPPGAARDRVLLDACLRALGAETGELLRCTVGSEAGGSWALAARRGDPNSAALPSTPPIALAKLGARGLELRSAYAADPAARERLEDLLHAVLVLETAEFGPPAALPSAAERSSPAEAPPKTETQRGLEHDARNALASIAATHQLLELLGSELDPAERARFEDALDRECARAGALLARGLGAADDQRPAPAAEVLRDVVDAERARAASRESAAREQGGPGPGLELAVDPGAHGLVPRLSAADFARLARNLIQNAREALERAGGTGAVLVELRPQPGGDGLVLRVRDLGAALPREPLARLFEPGVSVDRPAGSGLGLSVVRELALAAGGCVLAERIEAGASFEVWLPAARAHS